MDKLLDRGLKFWGNVYLRPRVRMVGFATRQEAEDAADYGIPPDMRAIPFAEIEEEPDESEEASSI